MRKLWNTGSPGHRRAEATPSFGRLCRAMTGFLDANLLLRQRDRKLAVADADRQAFDEFRHRVFAVGSDQFGEGCEQAGLRQAVAVDAVVARLRPGLVEIAQRCLLLFVVGQRVAGGCEGHWMAHETPARLRREPGRHAMAEV